MGPQTRASQAASLPEPSDVRFFYCRLRSVAQSLFPGAPQNRIFDDVKMHRIEGHAQMEASYMLMAMAHLE